MVLDSSASLCNPTSSLSSILACLACRSSRSCSSFCSHSRLSLSRSMSLFVMPAPVWVVNHPSQYGFKVPTVDMLLSDAMPPGNAYRLEMITSCQSLGKAAQNQGTRTVLSMADLSLCTSIMQWKNHTAVARDALTGRVKGSHQHC